MQGGNAPQVTCSDLLVEGWRELARVTGGCHFEGPDLGGGEHPAGNQVM